MPGIQTTNEDTALNLSAPANGISIVDPNAGFENVTLAIGVANGTLNFASAAGLTFIAGANGGNSMLISGTFSAINAALSSVTFTPALHVSGAASIGLAFSDVFNTAGAGVPISVTPVAHTPSITNAQTHENQPSGAGLVITPNTLDSGIAVYFKITQITGGQLFQHDGTTPIIEGGYITQCRERRDWSSLPRRTRNSAAAS